VREASGLTTAAVNRHTDVPDVADLAEQVCHDIISQLCTKAA
jgi:hypothetical protein